VGFGIDEPEDWPPLYGNPREMLSVGLQGSCILFLDPDRFDLTIGGRRQLFQAIAQYSRLLFSRRLPLGPLLII
jgi:hypothetical protein